MSELEEAFLATWRNLEGGPEPFREYVFCQGRKWRFDFAWIEQKVAVECEGGIFKRRGVKTPGGHRTIEKFLADLEKYNQAAVDGWTVLRFTVKDLERRPVQMVEMVQAALGLQPPGDR